MGWQLLVERILRDEVLFTFRFKIANGRWKRMQRFLAFGLFASGIQKAEGNTRGTSKAIIEEIEWEKELLESGRFKDVFSTNLFKNSEKISSKVFRLDMCIPDGEWSEV